MIQYIIVALMSMTEPSGENVYVFYKPQFSEIEECKLYARQNSRNIFRTLIGEFGPDNPPRIISCIPRNMLEDLVDLGNEV